MIILYKNVILACFGRVFTVILVGSIGWLLYLVLSFSALWLHCHSKLCINNYHTMINFVCNNHDRQYIKYFILHITNNIHIIGIMLASYTVDETHS